MNLRILQIAAAPPGWRLVEPYLGVMGPLEDMSDDQLFKLNDVACFALVEDVDLDGESPFVLPVAVDDWPGYLALMSSSGVCPTIDVLAPGKGPEEIHRQEAERMISAYRERAAAGDDEDRG